ncbi:glycosyltransferase family 9 protein [Niabella pedocola]|uniref:Glycosyltransferase family 9 protein n=1 Tax=Niabella pedocola TaxID=1752077 RepID=A0ABS8PKN3_9BACT|nr:glycosyltransferase family 9 protein [Niabella pedocola]MCD2421435.1 glycosyltransferase family 9 protein [Niabella pedocola]
MKATPKHILVFRFSALGDAAMTVPVLRLLLAQHPGLRVTMVSVPFHAPLFENIERLHFFGADIRKQYKGLRGLITLARRLKKDVPFDAVADLHNVLRTKIIRRFLGPVPIAVIDKGRSEKKELTRPHNKKLHPLKTTFQRYADVFGQLGVPVEISSQTSGISYQQSDISSQLSAVRHQVSAISSQTSDSGHQQCQIGIAPFAKHAAKMYPLEKMEQVVRLLQQDANHRIFLFGSKAEAPVLEQWAAGQPNIRVAAGRYTFAEELQLIAQMDVMLTMDSANMHLASLYGVPVVSIWGGTHPWLGFYGWGQDPENAVQTDLPCRPSSVFGNKLCPVHGEAGCMQEITPEQVYQKLSKFLHKKNN